MFSHILLPIDTAHDSSWQKALPLAMAEARHHGARVTAVAVIPDVETARPEHAQEEEQARLERIVRAHAPEGIEVATRVERGDSVHKTLRRCARDSGADLIVMASHHPEMKDYVLGSNASQVVHHADCSVLVVR
jgi:nucleotide-binding universal stress UspA family protein